MPIGYLVTAVFVACCALFSLAPVRRPWPVSAASYYFGLVFNELPLLACYWLAASSLLAAEQGDMVSPVGLAALVLSAAAAAGFAVAAARALPARGRVERALAAAFGACWRDTLPDPLRRSLRVRRPWARILFFPFPFRGRGVERLADLSYGSGKRNTFDVYRRPGGVVNAPVLVYLHGGRFVSGHKNREALPLLHRLARQGWLCVSANYRLSPDAVFPEHLIDLKKVLAWVREEGPGYGADPSTVFVAGSSAGGHLASFAGLTAGDPSYQPGFESADTSVSGVISLYGWYGNVNAGERIPSSPHGVLREDAPPFFVTHGDKDPLVHVEGARLFVRRLREVSRRPVVYAELPGAHHSYDLFHSLRCEAVVDGIEAFAAWVRARSAV